jgi:hypothetical protein
MLAIIWCSLLSKNLKIKIYRTLILPVVLYGCENWSLTLREESRLSVSKFFYIPIDAQELCFKRNIKIYIKNALTCFGLFTIIRKHAI